MELNDQSSSTQLERALRQKIIGALLRQKAYGLLLLIYREGFCQGDRDMRIQIADNSDLTAPQPGCRAVGLVTQVRSAQRPLYVPHHSAQRPRPRYLTPPPAAVPR